MRPAFSIALLLSLLLIFSCTKKHSHSFYYWKFNTSVSDGALEKINQLNVDHFYIHYMDVDWSKADNSPVPKSQLFHTVDTAFINKDCTPVVFITNAVFQHISSIQSEALAKNIISKTEGISHMLGVKQFNELQIDCDWTPTTKDRYFKFLTAIKKYIPGKQLSATIRLYPYKYSGKAGVPPVDKGVLMCYNIGGINTPNTINSIFSYTQLKQYITNNNYPLPLDIALPVFGWYAWFRGNTFKGIIYENDSFTSKYPFRKITTNSYLATTDTTLSNRYLREGDIIRKEYPDEQELIKAAKLVTSKTPKYNRIIFYYWDANNINRYENTIREVFSHY